ncbi:AMP-binding protein [Actinokineospora sp. UTMC 2448]|uniref:AMP-binding protein n=1 Tax=Actinokineospora sp. UTMC 2448 TaxID=2268449 RepID=UPI0021646BBE|nr:AMP-binding protein [Actinokineospora sp. UTMC 2448]UVS80310.1 Phenylacetate-coenzyme A ligase [Actinokineospora sp. UTMC 2448]
MSDYPIPAYEPMAAAVLSDAERWPAMTAEGARRLAWLRSHPRAPLYNHACGDRLSAEAVARLRAYPLEYGPPDWVPSLLAYARERVPRYRGRTWTSLADVLPIGRHELLSQVELSVPDDVDLDDLIVHSTSGSRGPAATVPMTPEFCALDLPLLEHVVGRAGIRVRGDGVALVTVYLMPVTYQFASVSSYWGGAGVVKVNLHPSAWRSPSDAVAFLEDCDPELYSGNPVSLAALADLGLRTRPSAVISGAMALDDPAALSSRLGAPVFDVYGTTETGLIAYRDGDAHTLLPRRMHVEVLDPAGQPCPDGVRGEITVTCGENPMLPLLRYRTGDHASLEWRDGVRVLVGLEGRAPVRFRAADGRWVESIEVTQVLSPLGLVAYSVHQNGDGSVVVTVPVDAPVGLVSAAAASLLGPVSVVRAEIGGKAQRYSSDLV